VAAGALIVKEAGGKVLDPSGGPFSVMARRVLAANNEHIATAAADILKTCPVSSAEPAAP
jgi:fructose-1,6-bisphosphatase/inositol monophosphatase family enzyme